MAFYTGILAYQFFSVYRRDLVGGSPSHNRDLSMMTFKVSSNLSCLVILYGIILM